jgi:hypothetical protein
MSQWPSAVKGRSSIILYLFIVNLPLDVSHGTAYIGNFTAYIDEYSSKIGCFSTMTNNKSRIVPLCKRIIRGFKLMIACVRLHHAIRASVYFISGKKFYNGIHPRCTNSEQREVNEHVFNFQRDECTSSNGFSGVRCTRIALIC